MYMYVYCMYVLYMYNRNSFSPSLSLSFFLFIQRPRLVRNRQTSWSGFFLVYLFFLRFYSPMWEDVPHIPIATAERGRDARLKARDLCTIRDKYNLSSIYRISYTDSIENARCGGTPNSAGMTLARSISKESVGKIHTWICRSTAIETAFSALFSLFLSSFAKASTVTSGRE